MRHVKKKTKLLTLLSSFAFCYCAYAQNFLTVKGGVDFTHPKDDKANPLEFYYNTGLGARLDVSYSIGIVKNLYLEPGLGIGYHTYINRGDDWTPIQPESRTNVQWQASMPVLVDYEIPLKYFDCHVFTGPQLNYGLCSKVYFEWENGHQVIIDHYKDDRAGKIYRFGTAWNIGTGVIIKKKVAVDFTASLGLNDLARNKREHYVQNNFYITLGYRFK